MDVTLIKGFIKTIAKEGYGLIDDHQSLHSLQQIYIRLLRAYEIDTGNKISGDVRLEVKSV